MKTYKSKDIKYLYDDIDYLLCYGLLVGEQVVLFGFAPLAWN